MTNLERIMVIGNLMLTLVMSVILNAYTFVPC
uniref:Uncharacterized protein n=1 Tax=Nelumbo nucifera TaxID=4432 RepID=A0A822Z6D7_NELNU|nr:TPA_asm: hypothetical protein HUJ06_013358 [Nelumbo nucifera]